MFLLYFPQGDYSNYEIQYNLNTKLSAGQKLTVLAGQMLVDYALFDGATEKCSADDKVRAARRDVPVGRWAPRKRA